MIFERCAGGRRQARGANGRTYTIGYAIGQPHPWVLEEDRQSRHRTLDEAEARAHEVEAGKLGEEQEKNLTWQPIT